MLQVKLARDSYPADIDQNVDDFIVSFNGMSSSSWTCVADHLISNSVTPISMKEKEMRGLFEVFVVDDHGSIFSYYIVANDETMAKLKVVSEQCDEAWTRRLDDVDILVRRIGNVR